jgi:hypothetical protein
MVCVITRHFAAIGKGFHRCALGFHADVAVPLQHPRLTCPAIAMMVESAAPLSASDVIAQCRQIVEPEAGQPAFFVSVRQADRQLLTCLVGVKAP